MSILQSFLYLIPLLAVVSNGSPESIADNHSVEPTTIAYLSVGKEGDRDGTPAGILGITVTSTDLRDAMTSIGAEPPQWIVIHINCDLGLRAETERLLAVVAEWRRRSKVIAWVSNAKSGAAIFAWSMDEIIYSPDGVIGPAEYPVARGDPELEKWLAAGDAASRSSSRPPEIMRAMITGGPLSYTVDQANGQKQWNVGENVRGNIVTLDRGPIAMDASLATRIGVSKMICKSQNEVEMALGLAGAKRVGKDANARLQRQQAAAEETRQIVATRMDLIRKTVDAFKNKPSERQQDESLSLSGALECVRIAVVCNRSYLEYLHTSMNELREWSDLLNKASK
jgi:hypothetical protein